jgi:hypothetical protein
VETRGIPGKQLDLTSCILLNNILLVQNKLICKLFITKVRLGFSIKIFFNERLGGLKLDSMRMKTPVGSVNSIMTSTLI